MVYCYIDGMAIYRLEKSQLLPIGLDEAWKFFSNPRNLKEITPPSLGLRLKDDTELPDEIYPGLMIEYSVTPLLGIRSTWLTEITHIQAPNYFVDEQRLGPYSLWHHEHHLVSTPNGVEIRDLIHYKVPFGPLGWLMNRLVIQRQLEEIFLYREKRMNELF